MIAVNRLKRTNSFYRFLLVGVANTLIGLSTIFVLLNLFGWTYWWATFTGNSIGAVISYFLNRSFTFNSRLNVSKGMPKFIIVIFICYISSYTMSGVVADIVTIPNWAASFVTQDELAILGGAILYTVTNYLGQKRFVFRILSEE
jgi:putative flippase GtrA